MQPLKVAAIDEKIVMSDCLTFETAEYNAEKWRKLGIQVEIAQPGRWQVWAKTEVYNA